MQWTWKNKKYNTERHKQANIKNRLKDKLELKQAINQINQISDWTTEKQAITLGN